MRTPELALIYGAGPDPWWIVETETGEIIDRFKDETDARETLEEWL